MLISAVICTYNRKELLANQVNAILSMEGVDSAYFEVIYVDNNSRDGTFEALTALCESNGLFRVVREQEQGLSAARNRGAREARGEYVWYMDDDSLPHERTLGAYLERLPEWKPEVATGPIRARLTAPAPWWFDVNAKEFRAYLALCDFGHETQFLSAGHAWGPNLVVQKKALYSAGMFDTSLGVSGKRRGGGEEDDLQNRIIASGGRLLYVHDASVDHLVLRNQMIFSNYIRQRFHRGASEGQMLARQSGETAGLIATTLRIGGHAGASMLAAGTGRVAPFINHLGACVGLYGKWSESRRWKREGHSARL